MKFPIPDFGYMGASGTSRESEVEKERALISRIENLKHVSDKERQAIILVWKGLKPAAVILLANERSTVELSEKAEKLFTELGLFMTESNSGIYLAKNKKDLERVNYIRGEEHLRTEEARELGRLFGYPMTAVEGYTRGREHRDEKKYHPEKERNEDYLAFVDFPLSKEHREEEIAVVKERAALIKYIDLPLYERMVQKYREEEQE